MIAETTLRLPNMSQTNVEKPKAVQRPRWILIAAIGIAGFLGFELGSTWWLTRFPDGVDCNEATTAGSQIDGLDFTPRFSEEKQIMRFEVRTAAGQEMPKCIMTQSAYRCSVDGPVMLRTKLWNRDLRYFPIGPDESAVILGTETFLNCTITQRNGTAVK
jgi:hypothetical protein